MRTTSLIASCVTFFSYQHTRSTTEPFLTGTFIAYPVTLPARSGSSSATIRGERDSCGMMFSAAARPLRMSSAGTSASLCWLV